MNWESSLVWIKTHTMKRDSVTFPATFITGIRVCVGWRWGVFLENPSLYPVTPHPDGLKLVEFQTRPKMIRVKDFLYVPMESMLRIMRRPHAL